MKNYHFNYPIIFAVLLSGAITAVFTFLIITTGEQSFGIYVGLLLPGAALVLSLFRLVYDIKTYFYQHKILKNGIKTTAKLEEITQKKRDMNGLTNYITLSFTDNNGTNCVYELPHAFNDSLVDGIQNENPIDIYAYEGKCLIDEKYFAKYPQPQNMRTPLFRHRGNNPQKVINRDGVDTIVGAGSIEEDENVFTKMAKVAQKTTQTYIKVRSIVVGLIIAFIVVVVILSFIL